MLTENIQIYLETLTEKYDSISAIWLIGSRANGCAHEHSDWDFFVFANNDILQSLRCDPTFKQNDIDLLVVYDGDSFTVPWGDNPKRGNLKEWKWSEKNENEAEYIESKWITDEYSTMEFCNEGFEMGDEILSEAKGVFIWGKSKGFAL